MYTSQNHKEQILFDVTNLFHFCTGWELITDSIYCRNSMQMQIP